MRMFVKGQVTMPLPVRKQAGVVPGSEVESHAKGNRIYLHKKNASGPGNALVRRMAGKGEAKMTTEEILNLTRKR